jgi:serine/threonine-protein kinase RsbW
MTAVLRVAADLNNLPAIRGFVEQTATALAAPAPAIDDLVLAVDESTTNIIEHGYCGQTGDIEIEMLRAGDTVVVHLRDQAPPFDPTRLPDPDLTLSLEERPVGRMGVFLTRQLVDAVTYRLTSQGANELTLTKKTAMPQITSQEIPHEHDL